MDRSSMLAEGFARLRGFLADWKETALTDRASADDYVRAWLHRAAVLQVWPRMMQDLVGTPPVRRLDPEPGLTGWFRRLTGKPDSDRGGDRPAITGGLWLSAVQAVVADWDRPQEPPHLLSTLFNQREITQVTSALMRQLTRASQASASHPPRSAETAHSTPERRAAAVVVVLVADTLAGMTNDSKVWTTLGEWTTAWLGLFGLRGHLSVGRVPTRYKESVQEYFELLGSATEEVTYEVEVDNTSVTTSPPKLPLQSPPSPWSVLPPPPQIEEVVPAVLVRWMKSASTSPATDEAAALQRFQTWLRESKEGEAWFHGLTSRAAKCPGPEREWWQVLRARQWCSCYPDLDSAFKPFWPTGLPQEWPTFRSTPSDDPIGAWVKVRRYAAVEGNARIVVSDGRPTSGSPAAQFGELVQTAPSDDTWRGGLWSAARTLTHATDADRPTIVDLALQLLERSAGRYDEAVLNWVRSFGIEVVPPGGGERTTYRFDPSAPGTVLSLSAIGFRDHDTVLHEGIVVKSLGPKPEALIQLEASANGLPADHPLRVGVEGLTAAAAQHYLLEAAVKLFTDYWDEAGRMLRSQRPSTADELSVRLEHYLADSLGLVSFRPTTLRSYADGWTKALPGSRLMTGRVLRLVRPGLQDQRGNLIVQAIAEVE